MEKFLERARIETCIILLQSRGKRTKEVRCLTGERRNWRRYLAGDGMMARSLRMRIGNKNTKSSKSL